MSTRAIRWVTVGAMALALGVVSYGQGPQGFIGIQLDPTPLPELLTKHLRLKANQGIRILNVSKDGPADKVGLDRDDIIILFQGKEVGDADEFVNAVHQLPLRSQVTLEVIHLGQHKTVEFELGPMEGEPQWKYPVEAQVEVSWGPGRIFRLGPNGGNWIEIPFDSMPNIGDLPLMKRFFAERYLSHHVTDGEDYTITIEGDPKDENTQIVVQSGPAEYSATVGTIGSLPEKYRASAKESVESAKKSASQRLHLGGKLPLPEPPNAEMYRKYFDNITLPRFDPNQWSDKKDRMIEKLQGQMDKLQQRLEQMEKHLDKTPDESEKNDPSSGTKDAPKPSEKAKIPNDEAI